MVMKTFVLDGETREIDSRNVREIVKAKYAGWAEQTAEQAADAEAADEAVDTSKAPASSPKSAVKATVSKASDSTP